MLNKELEEPVSEGNIQGSICTEKEYDEEQ